MQSPSVAQLVRHAVVLAHWRLPGQGAAVAVLHEPEPLQVVAGVSIPFPHMAAPQEMLVAASSHAPPAPHLPSLPHGGAAVHCPAGAGLPGVMLEQVPSATPVSARVQAWQVPEQAMLQQTPLAQKPLVHWSLAEQAAAGPLVGLQVPPVDRSQ
jgi:hypothetical protein